LFEDGGDRWIPRAQVTQMTKPEWNQDFEQKLGRVAIGRSTDQMTVAREILHGTPETPFPEPGDPEIARALAVIEHGRALVQQATDRDSELRSEKISVSSPSD
jgi:hypothetical protein